MERVLIIRSSGSFIYAPDEGNNNRSAVGPMSDCGYDQNNDLSMLIGDQCKTAV
jgi:hypothetical protein